eukprot:TRINITY_DN5376_c0_g6_i1.p1 TRINITY_DN5376_c0_g6~~TRINITY_DN5376_c0_g6_i1.p1  ORF type:complete len:316 (+),score=31.02 TRINITY_DN5376_c0_g6_i1:54-1001(+)
MSLYSSFRFLVMFSFVLLLIILVSTLFLSSPTPFSCLSGPSPDLPRFHFPPHAPNSLTEADFAIGILTTEKFHNRIPQIEASWKKKWINQKNIFYVSDNTTTEDVHSSDFLIAKLPNGKPCGKLLHDLGCKDEALYRHMLQQYPEKKWFVRAIDDTWINKENLLRFVSELDENEFHYIGAGSFYNYDKNPPEHSWTKPSGVDVINYCDGGAGWVLSRALLYRINEAWDLWRFLVKYRIWDDVIFGMFMREIQGPECNSGNTSWQFSMYPLPLEHFQDVKVFCEIQRVPVMIHSSRNRSVVETQDLFDKMKAQLGC